VDGRKPDLRFGRGLVASCPEELGSQSGLHTAKHLKEDDMPKYGKPVWGLMKQAAAQLPEPFSRKQIIQWFLTNYPKVPRNTVTGHIVSCCVNDNNRRHHNVHPNKDILTRLDNGLYVRYNRNLHGVFDSQGNMIAPPQQAVLTETKLGTGLEDQTAKQSPASEEVISRSTPNRSRHDEFIALFNDLGRSLKYNIHSTQAPFRHDVVWRKGGREPFIVIEVCDGGSLDKDLASLQWAANPENWGATGILVLDERDRQRALNRLGASNQIFVVPFDIGKSLCKLMQSYGDLIRLIL